ncbi:MAG: divergent PAP2 family protein [Candidatus Margulisiibacteriota bacterium]|jgi:hypothetical protein
MYRPVKDLGQITNLIAMNKPLAAALISLVAAQLLKLITYFFHTRKWNFRHLVTSGGLPSSHTSMVAALATAVGLDNGWSSPNFAISFVFSCIVMYDAAGVRRAAGKQARVLNQIMVDLVNKKNIPGEKLSELLGHTPFEVFAGATLGVLIAFLLY